LLLLPTEFWLYFVHIILAERFEVKTEADSNDITERQHDDQPSVGVFGSSDDLFFAITILFVFLSFSVADCVTFM